MKHSEVEAPSNESIAKQNIVSSKLTPLKHPGLSPMHSAYSRISIDENETLLSLEIIEGFGIEFASIGWELSSLDVILNSGFNVQSAIRFLLKL